MNEIGCPKGRVVSIPDLGTTSTFKFYDCREHLRLSR